MGKDTNPLTGQPIVGEHRGTTNQTKNSSGWRLVIMLVLGFVLGFGSAWLWVNRPAPQEEGTQNEMEEEMTASTNETEEVTVEVNKEVGSATVITANSDEVLVKDQGAGMTVFITRVALSENGWVAVQELLPNGQLGNILGAKRFDAGVAQGTVTLLRETVAGNEYRVTLRHDNGDGAFDHTEDALVVDASGTPLGMTFEVYESSE